MKEQLYCYVWGNSKTVIGRFRLKNFKGRVCKLLAHSSMNSRLIEFIDNGERLCCSGNALRKVLEQGKN